MKKIVLLLSIITALFWFGCGDKVDEAKNALELMNKAPEIAKDMEKGMEESQKLREERRKRGDTLALHFSKLQSFLPTEISGYKAEEPDGETMNMGGMSLSTSKIRFVKEMPDGNQSYINIQLTDYNQAVEMYAGLVFWGAGISIENSNGYERTYKTGIDKVLGYEKYDKSGKNSEVTLAVGYRFLVHLEANEQTNSDFLRKVTESINLKELAKY